MPYCLSLFLATLANSLLSARAHSWVACSDYRGDVNYFEQDKCVAWPRQYEPTPQDHGYQIADDEDRAWANGGCDRPMTSPDWEAAYTQDFPYAIYEPGKVYCLAWPMKNHATVFPGCENPHAKSDPGLDEEIALYISDLNPTEDPPQAVFNLRNINELAGLADNCSHVWTSHDSEMRDRCELGLEKHRTGKIDCKGFQRSPEFCKDTGRAMGTGCFQVPVDMHPGHYVAQWNWRATFPGRGSYGYTTCYDFKVVPSGSPHARPGTPGTTGKAAHSPICQNNMLAFSGITPAPTHGPGTPTPAPTPVPDTPAPTPESSCVQPYGNCHTPHTEYKCCTAGYECKDWNDDWAQCRPSSSTPAPTPAPGTPAPTPESSCVQPYENCHTPHTEYKCCTAGYECKDWNDDWAQCRPESEPPAPPAPPAPPSQPECSPPYQICAGPDWHGSTCCTTGHECKAQNEHWSQCMPTKKAGHRRLRSNVLMPASQRAQ